jgi:hypothetical protein
LVLQEIDVMNQLRIVVREPGEPLGLVGEAVADRAAIEKGYLIVLVRDLLYRPPIRKARELVGPPDLMVIRWQRCPCVLHIRTNKGASGDLPLTGYVGDSVKQ